MSLIPGTHTMEREPSYPSCPLVSTGLACVHPSTYTIHMNVCTLNKFNLIIIIIKHLKSTLWTVIHWWEIFLFIVFPVENTGTLSLPFLRTLYFLKSLFFFSQWSQIFLRDFIFFSLSNKKSCIYLCIKYGYWLDFTSLQCSETCW